MDKDNIKHIYERTSKRIKMFRKFRKLTQEQLSEASTFSRGFIGNIEGEHTEQTFSLGVLYYISLIHYEVLHHVLLNKFSYYYSPNSCIFV